MWARSADQIFLIGKLRILKKKRVSVEGIAIECLTPFWIGRVKKIFDVFDTDGSGDIDAEEFQNLAYKLGETLTKEEIIEYIKQIDINGNGRVDFDEFFNWWSSIDPEAR